MKKIFKTKETVSRLAAILAPVLRTAGAGETVDVTGAVAGFSRSGSVFTVNYLFSSGHD
ncbi:MAG: hypothetical protein LBF85_06735 [Tannerella sp.]|jgi:hypothetical protein|nr:hypothetical protein [Tannerella sp.]